MTLWTHIGVADGVQGIMEVDCMDGWVVGEEGGGRMRGKLPSSVGV